MSHTFTKGLVAALVLLTAAAAVGADDPELPYDVVRTTTRYPVAARRERIEGRVMARLTVAEDGSVRAVEILESTPPGVFDDAVRDSAKGWVFRYLCGPGFPRQFQVLAPFEFKLRDIDAAGEIPILRPLQQGMPPSRMRKTQDGWEIYRPDPCASGAPTGARAGRPP